MKKVLLVFLLAISVQSAVAIAQDETPGTTVTYGIGKFYCGNVATQVNFLNCTVPVTQNNVQIGSVWIYVYLNPASPTPTAPARYSWASWSGDVGISADLSQGVISTTLTSVPPAADWPKISGFEPPAGTPSNGTITVNFTGTAKDDGAPYSGNLVLHGLFYESVTGCGRTCGDRLEVVGGSVNITYQ